MISRSLLRDVTHVWSQDPDLDKANENFSFELFMQTGDLKHMPAKEGTRVATFVLAPLTRVQYQRVQAISAAGDTGSAACLAAAYGLRSCSGFTLADGSELVVKQQTDGDGERRATKETLDGLYDFRLIAELGHRVIHESQLRPRNGQG